MSTPWSWSGGSRRQADKVRWSQKVMEMGWGTDKDKKGKKGGHTMTFISELDKMFADPNCQATAQRKLATLHQGDSSVEELIRKFEIHVPISGLGNVGLVDQFKQAIHPCLRESIYRLEPMPTTWAEWKCKTSLLNNQWR